MTNNNKTETLIYTGLFGLAIYICLTSCLNPFGLKIIDSDTSVYLTIAQGITRGQVPFRDFYDNKGPLLYLMSAPGFALGRFTGVWFTELIFMCISVFFAYKTSLFFGSRAFAFTGVVLGFIVLQGFFEDVAGTEEYSLPFMMISMYIFTRYHFTQKNIHPTELVILGFCFASSVLIRINLFPLWFGFCIMIYIETVKKRDFPGLIKYILLFCIGISIITIPIMIYLKANNAIMYFIQQNFLDGSSRGFTDFSFKYSLLSFFIITGKNFCFVPLLAGFIWIIKNFTNDKKWYYMGYSLAFILTVIFHAVIRSNFDHYNITLTPFLVPAFTFFIKDIFGYFLKITGNKSYFALFICILFSAPFTAGFSRLYYSLTDQSRRDIILTGKTIDEQTIEGDKIIFLGFPCHIYLFTQRDTASRYIYQIADLNYAPKNEQNEFLMDLQKNKPAIIVLKNNGRGYTYLSEWYAPVYNIIENEYQMITDKYGYYLFKRIHIENV